MEDEPIYIFPYKANRFMQNSRLKVGNCISTDIEYILSIQKKIAQFIGRDNEKNSPLYLVKHQGWSARAFYDGEFYEDDQEKALAKVLQAYGYTSFVMMPLCLDLFDKSKKMVFDLLEEPSTYEGFEEVRLNHCLSWYILYGGQPDWIILLTPVDDFMIVIGRKQIFDSICSNFSSDVWTGIEEMANSDMLNSHRRFLYNNLIDNLNNVYETAPEGEILYINLMDLKE
jgi:hypothetical protein